jgi:hypothetical protein
MRFGIILLPSSEVSAHISNLSAYITGGVKTHMRLDPEKRPHLSILHFEGSLENALELWKRTKTDGTGDEMLSIQIIGFMFSPIAVGDLYVPEGGVYCGLEVARSSHLTAKHLAAVKIAKKLKMKTIGSIEDAFRPHVTLAVTAQPPSEKVSLPPQLFSNPLSFRPAFGLLGDYGTFSTIIEE